ncbi:hypothetical protein Tco_0581568 [Tanacetum coccineum]
MFHRLSRNYVSPALVGGCTTTFLLWSSPPQSEPHETIVIAHVNSNHYTKAALRECCPLPMTHPLWRSYKSDIASRWEYPYGSSKRHKSSGSSSFNTKSRDASINLNNIVAGDDEVQEIRQPVGRDKARAAAKNKGSKTSGSSTMNDDALAMLVVNEMTTAEVEQREAFIEVKMREVECHERDIATTEYRAQQEDMKFYL